MLLQAAVFCKLTDTHTGQHELPQSSRSSVNRGTDQHAASCNSVCPRSLPPSSTETSPPCSLPTVCLLLGVTSVCVWPGAEGDGSLVALRCLPSRSSPTVLDKSSNRCNAFKGFYPYLSLCACVCVVL